MIKFHRIAYKNFLSTGDDGNEIILDDTPTTIVTGTNGSGKSTFIDAIVYALFGKPFRKVKLGMLVNNINEKGLYVEIEFSIGSNHYLIKRGMKPSIFEIYCNDEMIEKPSSNPEYQKILEDEILRLNYNSFTQIIILGSASYKPFMELPLGNRREIIENLLDISIFSEMNILLKADVKKLKNDIVRLESEFAIAKEKYKMSRDAYDSYMHSIDTDIQKFKDRIESYRSSRDSMLENIEVMASRIRGKKKAENDLAKYRGTLKKLDDAIASLDNDIRIYTNEIDQLNNSLSKIKDIDIKIEAYRYKKNMLKRELSELHEKIDNIKKEISDAGGERDISDITSSIAVAESHIYRLNENIRFYESNNVCPTCKREISDEFAHECIDNANKELSEFKDKLAEYKKKYVEINEHNDNIRQLKDVLLDISNKIKNVESDLKDVTNTLKYLEEDLATEKENLTYIDVAEIKEEIDKCKKRKAIIEDTDKKHISKKIRELESKLEYIGEIETKIIIAKNKVSNFDDNIVDAMACINEIKKRKKPISEENIQIMSTVVNKLSQKIDKYKEKLSYYEIISKMLKDDGIKSIVIKRFIPIINSILNKYLDKFEFPVIFTFDENFNETIESPNCRQFTYYSFSEGEKARINLAILFTWREIALTKSRNSSNLIIFDEIFDGSLDSYGIDNFMNVLGLDDSNAFILTHDNDVKTNDFDRSLVFEKEGHFSNMAVK